MNHPASCKNPAGCGLSYVEHLRGFVIGAAAMPSRAVTRTPGQPDEPTVKTLAREKRWEKDMPAFKRLMQQGYLPPLDGAARLEATATSAHEINGTPDFLDAA